MPWLRCIGPSSDRTTFFHIDQANQEANKVWQQSCFGLALILRTSQTSAAAQVVCWEKCACFQISRGILGKDGMEVGGGGGGSLLWFCGFSQSSVADLREATLFLLATLPLFWCSACNRGHQWGLVYFWQWYSCASEGYRFQGEVSSAVDTCTAQDVFHCKLKGIPSKWVHWSYPQKCSF